MNKEFDAFETARIIESGLKPKDSLLSLDELSSENPSKASLVSRPQTVKSDKEYQLPLKQHGRATRNLLYILFTVYRRLFSLVVLANLIIFVSVFLVKPHSSAARLQNLATSASSNLLLAVLVRQEFFVNGLYRIAWFVPWSAPLRIRRLAARVYTYGGIHSGAAVSGTLWFLGYVVLLTAEVQGHGDRDYTAVIIFLAWLIQMLLVSILVFAYPSLRLRFHDRFETTHRFGGWIAIDLFWGLVILSTLNTSRATGISFGKLLISQPTFWNLSLMTFFIVLPWLHLRKWTFTAERLSAHAVRLHFNQTLPPCSCLNLSTHPLLEWHPFATFPSPRNNDGSSAGGSMIVSAAGDWTRSVIASSNSNPNPTFWTKGVPKTGVLSLSLLFRRVVFITTGSGIGPVLFSLLSPDRPVDQFIRVIWSTPSPRETFGAEIVNMVRSEDAGAIIIDTKKDGRRDLVKLALMTAKRERAEAVFVLSNKSVTTKIIYGLESRGVVAFGPIWDS